MRRKDKFTNDMKRCLLKIVMDDLTFEAIKNNPTKINEAFDVNLANIIIATRGEF